MGYAKGLGMDKGVGERDEEKVGEGDWGRRFTRMDQLN